MSILQEQAVQMISGLSDDNVRFLIEVIQRLMPEPVQEKTEQSLPANESIQAFQRLNAARDEVWKYLPDDFDPDHELEKARAERYGSIA